MLCEAMSKVVILIKKCGVGEGGVGLCGHMGWEVMEWWRRELMSGKGGRGVQSELTSV